MSQQQPDDGPIWRNGAFHADGFTRVGADDPLPAAGAVLVPKARWLAERDALRARNEAVGVFVDAGESIDDLAADLPRLQLVALNFPKYADGRAFSKARLLRDKYGYRGEVRAVGNVLNDQIPFMWRVGFDSLHVTHAPTRAALKANRLAHVKLYYQPAQRDEAHAGKRPWLRQA